MEWYYSVDGETLGPVSGGAVLNLVRAGVLHQDTFVWKEGMSDWKRAVDTELALALCESPLQEVPEPIPEPEVVHKPVPLSLESELKPQPRVNQNEMAQVADVFAARVQWFYWIAALSFVNSIVGVFGGGVFFVLGLGVSLLVDQLGHHLAGGGAVQSGIYLSFGINMLVSALFALMGYLAGRGNRAVYILGMALYGLDGAIFLLDFRLFPIAVHGYALYKLLLGYCALSQLKQMKALSDAD